MKEQRFPCCLSPSCLWLEALPMWQALVQYSCAWLAGWLAARPINGGFLHFIFLSSVHALPVQLEWKPKFDNNGPYSQSSPPRCHCLVNVTSLLHSLHATLMSVSRLLLLVPMCTYSWLLLHSLLPRQQCNRPLCCKVLYADSYWYLIVSRPLCKY